MHIYKVSVSCVQHRSGQRDWKFLVGGVGGVQKFN